METSKLTMFAKISGITYQDPAVATPLFKELGYNVVKFFDKKGAQAYLIKLKASLAEIDSKLDSTSI